MVTCGSAFPAESSLMPWCTSGLLSRCSSFRLLQGAFLEVSPELTAGLETQHNNQELSQPGMFPCRKWSLKGNYSSLLLVRLYSQMSTLAVSPSRMCMAYPAQHGDSQGVNDWAESQWPTDQACVSFVFSIPIQVLCVYPLKKIFPSVWSAMRLTRS